MAGVFVVDDLSLLRELEALVLLPEEEREWQDQSLGETRRVVVSDCRLEEWPDLRFPAAEHLTVSFNLLSDIRFVESSKQLIHLDISHNRVTSLDALSSLTLLETLRFQNNQVRSLQPLSALTSLKEMNAEYNQIPWTEFQTVSNFRQLKILNTSHNTSCDSQEDFSVFVRLLSPSLVFLNGKFVENMSIDDQRATSIREMYDKAMIDSSKLVTASSSKGSECLQSQNKGRLAKELKKSSSVGAVSKQKSLVSTRLSNAISQSQIHLPATPMQEYSQTVKFGRGDFAPLALGIDSVGCGFLRWSRKSTLLAIEFNEITFHANYRMGSVAVDMISGVGTVFDQHGRVLLRVDTPIAYVIDALTNDVTHEFHRDKCTAENFQYKHDNLSILFDPNLWDLEVIVRLDIAVVSCSSQTGMRLRKKKESWRKRKQESTDPPVSELENLRAGAQSVVSELTELDSLLKNMFLGR